jgi:apolipoprotein N-acyltransferase
MKLRPELQPQPDRWSYGWLLLGLVFNLFTFGPWLISGAIWLSLFFLVRFLRTQRVLPGILIVMATTAVATIYVGHEVVPFPLPLTVLFLTAQAILGALPLLADRLLAPRLPGFLATLILPLAATGWEFINLTTSPMGSFGSQAYTQYGNLPLMQLVSVTGIWGLTFLINWFAAVGNWAWAADFRWVQIRRGVLLYAGTVAIVLLYGNVRLLSAPPASESMRIAGISAAAEDIAPLLQLYATDRQAFAIAAQARQERYLAATAREAAAGAQMVIWPEGAVLATAAESQALIEQGQALAEATGIYLALQVVTFFDAAERPAENKLFLVDPAGALVLEHTKYGGNFLEGTLAGDKILRTVESPAGRLAGVICWDADFVDVLRQTAQQEVDLLFIGANDWAGVSEVHAQMAVFRAIENGVVLFRQAYGGVSLATDPYGRVLAQVDHYATTDRTLIAQVPTHAHRFTLYRMIGDAVGWAALGGFVLLGLVAISGRLRAAQPAFVPAVI